MDVIISSRSVGGIPVLELFDAAGTERPLVIMYHGYVNRKDFMLNQAYFLASQGFAVVVPDAWGHGDRGTGGLPDFFTAVIKTADEIDGLIEHYERQPFADAGRVGLTGYSMGGCIVYETIARVGRRVKAAVPFIATPDWVSLMSAPGTAYEFAKSGIVAGPEGMAPFIAAAGKVQPLNRIANMAGVPLLMLNGAEDPLMPAKAVERFYETLKPMYSNGGDVRLCILPGVGHSDNVEMNMKMAAWFAEYLV